MQNFAKLMKICLIRFLSFSALCSIGFCSFIFFDAGLKKSTMSGKIQLEQCVDFGSLKVIAPKNLDYEEYRIVFEQGGNGNEFDESIGICLTPHLEFVFSEYDFEDGTTLTENGYFVSFYLEFANDGVLFGDEGYAEFSSRAEGQSYETRIRLEIDETAAYTLFTFEPIFVWREGKKPSTSREYAEFLKHVYEDSSVSVLTLHLTFEREEKR